MEPVLMTATPAASAQVGSWLSDGLDVFAELATEAKNLAVRYGPDAMGVLGAAVDAATARDAASLTALWEAVQKLIADHPVRVAAGKVGFGPTDIAAWVRLAQMIAAMVQAIRDGRHAAAA